MPYIPLGRGFFSAGEKLVDNLPDHDFRNVFGIHLFLLMDFRFMNGFLYFDRCLIIYTSYLSLYYFSCYMTEILFEISNI